MANDIKHPLLLDDLDKQYCPEPESTSKSGYKWCVLLLLLAIYCFGYIDRQIIAVLSPQIKAELALSDTQLGAIKGIAFSLFYSAGAVPFAIVADRCNRVKLIGIAVAAWSLSSASCAAAQNFLQLFLARSCVGASEAGGSPASHALLSDYFPRSQRATAIGIYQLGVPIGTFVSFLLGGSLAASLGWRLTFVVVALPGLILSVLLMTTVGEVSRGRMDGNAAPKVQSPAGSNGWVKQAKALFTTRSFSVVAVAGGLQAFGGYSMSMWLFDLKVRLGGETPHQAALGAAIVLGLGGGIGTATGGFVADYLGRRGPANYFLMPGVAMLLCCPLLIIGLNDSAFGMGAMFLASFCLFGCMGPLYGIVQLLAPSNCRALAVAIYSLSLGLIGAGLGPFLVGLLSDTLNNYLSEAEALRWALYTVPLAVLTSSAILLANTSRISQDLQTRL